MTPFGRAALFAAGAGLTRRQAVAVLAVGMAGPDGIRLERMAELLELEAGAALEWVLGRLALRGVLELVDGRVVPGRRIAELVA